ncbi:hypothetical protein [Streptomyces sp. H51]|uniref:hypothetical protein n=1 Tax=Streptomyces sp. H51 TaxID=3111770 RepID=UPI002D773F7C|nr:hypothetical protein [Streptomyces sp. H51]
MPRTLITMPLIGREDEVARLSRVLERAHGGEPRGVLLLWLLARGLGNRQIGEEPFVTGETARRRASASPASWPSWAPPAARWRWRSPAGGVRSPPSRRPRAEGSEGGRAGGNG